MIKNSHHYNSQYDHLNFGAGLTNLIEKKLGEVDEQESATNLTLDKFRIQISLGTQIKSIKPSELADGLTV